MQNRTNHAHRDTVSVKIKILVD